MEAHAAESPTVQAVCEAAGVSWRTLNYAFRELSEGAPKEYLQAARLDGVRRELLGSEATAKVGDIANNWGFWYMGQFAADYRRQFSELPSETLRRTRSA
jgi:AraC family transcriptional regulator, ethanolamine operon transcriptional activator